MKFSNLMLMASVAAVSLGFGAYSHAHSTDKATVTTETVVQQKHVENIQKVNFQEFDLNNDQVLSMEEVGEKLFYLFDQDGNEVIDNIEFDNKTVMTIIPMEKETYTYVDWGNDGTTDVASVEYEVFFKQSDLMRFDKNMNGLSPEEFIEESFISLDDNDDKTITVDEWKEAYEQSTRPESAQQEIYN